MLKKKRKAKLPIQSRVALGLFYNYNRTKVK